MTLDDQAAAAEERFREAALNAQRINAAKKALRPCGACHYCGESVRTGMLFCGRECRDDFEREQMLRERHG